jgi:hypothetical protein
VSLPLHVFTHSCVRHRQVWMFFGLITCFFWVPVVFVGALFLVSFAFLHAVS